MAERDDDFEALLEYLRDSRGFDFTGYKRSTLVRRVTKRMTRIGVSGFDRYLDHLQADPTEFTALFDEILINVTSYFRDPDAWDFIAHSIIPQLAERATAETPLRCWCAGVASGQEAYSLAMLMAEAMGTTDLAQRLKIYATDVDESALGDARHGVVSSGDLETLPAELRERYLEEVGGRHVFRGDLRRAVIFGRHDLVQDAPISRLDLLICRNTLMYFTAETQTKILGRFHYALNDDGFLFLGKGEMMLTHADLFIPVEMRYRVFRKVRGEGVRECVAIGVAATDPPPDTERLLTLLEHAADAQPAAQVVIDQTGKVVAVNAVARAWFRLTRRDVDRPLQDLELSYRPVELRSLIEKARADRREIVVRNVERALSESESQYLDVHVVPLTEAGRLLGASITYADVTGYNRVEVELERSRQALETAYEELQSTNEELETTNEELQSTVEELETTNEELQSSNEELETMNEELESTNSELQAINGELRDRTQQVDQGNAFFESILTSLRLAVIVVDADLRVKLWRGRSEDMWGVRAAEVQDQPLGALDIGLPLNDVERVVRRSLTTPEVPQVATFEATNRRGRGIRCRVVANALPSVDGSAAGVTLLIEETAPDAR